MGRAVESVLVPRGVTTTSAELMAAAFGEVGDEAPGAGISVVSEGCEAQPIVRWTSVYEGSRVWTARVPVRPTSPRQEYRLRVGGRPDSSPLSISTLPQGLGSEPFRVLLGSCFEAGGGRSDALAWALRRAGRPPDLKFLCGDQVYLDPGVALPAPSEAERVAALYRSNWTHPGFAALLANGANFMCSWAGPPHRGQEVGVIGRRAPV